MVGAKRRYVLAKTLNAKKYAERFGTWMTRFSYYLFTCLFLIMTKYTSHKIYHLFKKNLFIFRERGQEGEREGEQH